MTASDNKSRRNGMRRGDLRLDELERRIMLSTFIVTSTVDDPASPQPGTLRRAIVDANANPGADVIQFNLAGAGPFTIAPQDDLPTITEALVIDGTTQPGYVGTPLIELEGSGLTPGTADGFYIAADNCEVRGLAINSFLAGIRVEGDGSLIENNYIGVDVTGTAAVGNAEGIALSGGANTIRGNVISGNTSVGVDIFSAPLISNVDNLVEQNLIGTDVTGTVDLGNGWSGLTLGTASSTVRGNVISGNGFVGLEIGDVPGVVVEGNFIGTNADGTGPLGNDGHGILLHGSDATIGGPDAAKRNVISANGMNGIFIVADIGQLTPPADNVVTGNYIGTNATADADFGNAGHGVFIEDSSNNTIGGTGAGEANVIAGNAQSGVRIKRSEKAGAQATGNKVRGNFIGTNASDWPGLGNDQDGVSIHEASGNAIGGSAAGARNIISGNRSDGVSIEGAHATGNHVQGNYIGVNGAGTAVMANLANGVLVLNASGNTIGGSRTVGEGNLISGNGESGVRIESTGLPIDATGNFVSGSFIGTDKAGQEPIANLQYGVLILNASGNTVGGAQRMATLSNNSNLISGNVRDGVAIISTTDETVEDNRVSANFIGTNKDGNAAVPNFMNGVYLYNASRNRIGGRWPNDQGLNGGNVISGNDGDGILVNGGEQNRIEDNIVGMTSNTAAPHPLGNGGDGVRLVDSWANELTNLGNVVGANAGDGLEIAGDSSGNIVWGNNFGTDGDSNDVDSLGDPLGNHGHGIFVNGGDNNLIGGGGGGGTGFPGNVISGNYNDGVYIKDATGNQLVANKIGTNSNGNETRPNGGNGIRVDNGVLNQIGSPAVLNGGNIIGGNGQNGVYLLNGSDGNTLLNNYIGTGGLGEDLSNTGHGVYIRDGSSNTIGANAALSRNVISNNLQDGIRVEWDGNPEKAASGNVVQGNYIGLLVDGTHVLGNLWAGVALIGASDNLIGGAAAGQGNLVSGNGLEGVHVQAAWAAGNQIAGNLIGTNAAGNAALGNGGNGVWVEDAPGNTIGGNGAGEGNVIAGHLADAAGVKISGGQAVGNFVYGNFIGDGRAFQAGFGNTIGVELSGGANANAIGAAGVGNVISQNVNSGILIRESHNNTVAANWIGTDRLAIAGLGNGSHGVEIVDAATTTVGGFGAADANIIVTNRGDGVRISSTTAPADLNTSVYNNLIGTNVAGDPLGNDGHGVLIDAASRNKVGGILPGMAVGNAIKFNALSGVAVVNGSVWNEIRDNRIASNGGLGIDLNDDGVTLNDNRDLDTGPNNLQNFPILTEVGDNGAGGTTIRGYVLGTPAATLDLDFYSNTAADPSGYGEGETLIGTLASVGIAADGSATFEASLPGVLLPPGTFVTSTATRISGADRETSEFSGPYGHPILPGIDFGDAPDDAESPGYATLSVNDGARHTISPDLYLGVTVDPESDGQPTVGATGDDTTDNGDEDGVSFSEALVAGETGHVSVTASNDGLLDAWIDFNRDGDWADAGEQIFASRALTAGANALSFPVPATAVAGASYARFRLSSAGGLSFDGPADDGEVEDYAVQLHGVDWGDAPDPGYPTLRASDGARHVLGVGPYLGAAVDGETDGQPDADALGDDNSGLSDEDGVTGPSNLVIGQTAGLTVTASGPGFLDAWVDFNADGDWDDAGEQVFAGESVIAGANALSFVVPADAGSGETYARFRLSSGGGLAPSGLAADGEVEDYLVSIGAPGRIEGHTWHDLDGDGTLDADEPGLADWTVYLDSNDNGALDGGEPTATTGADGHYVFDGLGPGTYHIREVREDDWHQSKPVDGSHTVVLASGQTASDKDFGNYQWASLSGAKFEDANRNGVLDTGEPGLADWTIYLDSNDTGALDGGEPTATTGADGGYAFTDVQPGSYVVREVMSDGWTQTAPAGGEYVLDVQSGQTVSGLDFGNVQGVLVVVGDAGARQLSYTDGDGTAVTVKVKGGSASVLLQGNNLSSTEDKKGVTVTGDDVTVEEVALSDTTEKSALTFKTKGGDGYAEVGEITGSSPMKKLKAKTVDLVGAGIVMTGGGIFDSLDLHNAADGADIVMPGNSAKGVSVKANQLGAGSDIVLGNAGLKSLKATSWAGSGLTAPSAGKLTLSGDMGADITVDDLSALTVKGTLGGAWTIANDVGKVTADAIAPDWNAQIGGELGKLTVKGDAGDSGSGTQLQLTAKTANSISIKGALENALLHFTENSVADKVYALTKLDVQGLMQNVGIRSAGNIKQVGAGSMTDSLVFAGVSDAVSSLPSTLGDFVRDASIDKLSVKDAFSNGFVSAQTLGKIRLGGADTDNDGTVFGLSADLISSVTYETTAGQKQALKEPEVSTSEGDFRIEVL